MRKLFSEEMRRNPYPTYDQLRGVSPVLHDPQSDFWMLFDYESVKRALNDHDVFSSRAAPPGGGALDWLIFLDPPRHTKLRGLIARAFTPRSVANLEPRIRELSRELLNHTIEQGEMDLATDFALPLPMMVIAELLGIPVADRPRFLGWNEVILNMIYTIQGGPEAERAVREFGAATAEMRTYLVDLLEQRRVTPQDDLLTRLVEAEVDGERLSAQDLLSFFQLLLVAGSETTTNLINNALLCFVENPDQLALLRASPSFCPRRSRRSSATARRSRWCSVRRSARSTCMARLSPRRRWCWRWSAPPTATLSSFETPAISTSCAIPTRTSRSATASTSAWERRWRAWRPGSPSRISSSE